MILFIQTALAASCPEPVAPTDLLQLTAQARDAFAMMDAERFTGLVTTLESGVDCLDRALSPQQAAEIHTVRALSAFLASDEVSSGASFQAALAAQPDLTLDWLPPGHPIFFELRYAERVMIDDRRALRPAEGLVMVDGHMAAELARERPAILQRQENGAVVESALVRLGEPTPSWAPLAPEPLSAEVKRRIWLGGAATVSALSAGTLLGLSAQSREAYLRTTDHELLPDLERRTNLTSAASIAMAGVAAGFGVGLVVAW